MKDQIIDIAESPGALEALYRTNPKEFTRCFADAFAEQNTSTILQVWHERLFFQESEAGSESLSTRWQSRDIWVTVILSFIAGTLVKLPHFFSVLNEDRFYSRNLGGIIFGSLIAFFCLQKRFQMRTAGIVSAALISGMLYLNILPDDHRSQTIVLSCLHMPFFFWSLLGIAFLGGSWRELSGRMDYMRYNGELLIYSTIVLLGGMVLTGLTIALFGAINLHSMENWYLRNVVPYGATASPIVATLLIERIVGNRFKLAQILAKVFMPLFLLTLFVYFLAMLDTRSPFKGRDFLISFNVLLLVVLGLCIFSISERGNRETTGIFDFMNIMLVAVTLAIDVIALAAILFRLTSYGFTPNRIAVLGANILTFGHLAGILWHYIRFFRHKSGAGCIERWIAAYMPAYMAWSFVVSVGFPLIFRFK